MLFLIDYENVGNAGMRGCHYLNESDFVIIFYSDAKKHMERRYLESITNSGCTFETCKLCKQGKNALDFYIASKLGELFGSGFEGTAMIISRDNGFQAVRDYWEKKAARKRKVILSISVEDGIASGNENSERAKELKKLRENMSVESFSADYQERLRVKEVVNRLFEGTEHEDKTEEIQRLMLNKEKTPKMIYLNCLHTFGRDGGLTIYNRMKACKEL